ncbi:uncharacterized protein LOC106129537 isoform X2 [Amyelois transitella]|uniref:uncharacterized protein LOC106129537 isoform X2 n=1 Tax=Amyelois transitella TaxID=680683 RepID=UPI00298FE3B8|nr:uncharacterized protein LOC106129537 isoform X2 [Amyelois transitella]
MLASFHMWLVWVIVYSSQIHPIQGPIFSNTTLTWISVYWGNGEGIGVIDLNRTSAPTTTTITPPPTLTIYTAEKTAPYGVGFQLEQAEQTKGGFEFELQTTQPIQAEEPYKAHVYLHTAHTILNSNSRYVRITIDDTIKQVDITEREEGYETTMHVRETKQLETALLLTNQSFTRFWVKWEDNIITLGQENGARQLRSREQVSGGAAGGLSGSAAEDGAFKSGGRKHHYDEIPGTHSTTSGYVIVESHYKFFMAQSEPIQFGVLLEGGMYREFFVLLTTVDVVSQPNILIHIGAYEGSTCLISKNYEVVKEVGCKLDWKINRYLMFWIWHNNGEISVVSGYETPDQYDPIVTWTDPSPDVYHFYGLRTIIGETIPMFIAGDTQY